MKKILVILLACVLTVFCFAACKGGDSSSGDKTSTAASADNGKTNTSADASSGTAAMPAGLDFDTVYDEATEQDGYAVAKGSCNDKDIVIPSTRTSYFGDVKPILWDYGTGFYSMENTESVTFSEGFLEIRVGFAFSYHLKKLTLPSTLRKIDGYGILQSCTRFEEIVYNGTKAQWEAVEKTDGWNMSATTFTVHCTDGTVTVNG